jgi:hypothetical protein
VKNMSKYEVVYNYRHKYNIEAKTSDAAKREVCRQEHISPSDYFCGLSLCKAKKIK